MCIPWYSLEAQLFLLALVASTTTRALPLNRWICVMLHARNLSIARLVRHAHHFARDTISFLLKRIIRFADAEFRLQRSGKWQRVRPMTIAGTVATRPRGKNTARLPRYGVRRPALL